MNYRFLTKNDEIGLVETNQDLSAEPRWMCNNENKGSSTGRGLSNVRQSPNGGWTRASGRLEDLEMAHSITRLTPTHLSIQY